MMKFFDYPSDFFLLMYVIKDWLSWLLLESSDVCIQYTRLPCVKISYNTGAGCNKKAVNAAEINSLWSIGAHSGGSWLTIQDKVLIHFPGHHRETNTT
jgi:hypothetical protein